MNFLCLNCPAASIKFPDYPGEEAKELWLNSKAKCKGCGKTWTLRDLL